MAIEKWLVINPQQTRLALTEDHRTVLLMFDVSDPSLGLAPGLGVSLEMSPSQARTLGQSLSRKADEAEAGLPRA